MPIKDSKVRKLLMLGLTTGLILNGSMASYVRATSTDETMITYPYYGFVEDPEKPWNSVYDALDETGEVQYSDA